MIDLVVPDIPESLDVKIKRERYLAKEALQDAEHVLQVLQETNESYSAFGVQLIRLILRAYRAKRDCLCLRFAGCLKLE